MVEQMDGTEFARRAKRLVEQVAESGREVVVQHEGRPVAVLISAGDYQTFQRLKGQRQIRFRRDLDLIHQAAEEAALVNSFSDERARDVAKQAQLVGRSRLRTGQAGVRGVSAGLPHFGGELPAALTEAPGPGGVPRMTFDTHLLLTYLIGAGKELRPMLDAWAGGQIEVLVPRFLLLDLRGGIDALAEQGRLDPEAGECLLELLAREGEPVADPLLPAGFLPGWRGRLN
ncbi:MAG TPA: type II toxin-antitoxin system prevent-host-death family antitoxin [Chloroflexia bacterium]|nr:type II toxin-antitoxin system prevent-host-death family antitoxin [Chloroflexia bacterium]